MPRIGQVFLEDYDVGIARTIGGELIDIERDGETVQKYAVKIDGVTGPPYTQELVPIDMADSEDAFSDQLLPQIVIARGSIIPQMERWQPGGHAYHCPAPASQTVTLPSGLQGPSMLEFKALAFPFEITYDIHLRGRVRLQADRLLRHMGKFFWAYGQVYVKDSEGCERGYYTFVDSYEQLAELDKVSERVMGHTISMRVEAELDFYQPITVKTTPNLEVSIGFTVESLERLSPSARAALKKHPGVYVEC